MPLTNQPRARGTERQLRSILTLAHRPSRDCAEQRASCIRLSEGTLQPTCFEEVGTRHPHNPGDATLLLVSCAENWPKLTLDESGRRRECTTVSSLGDAGSSPRSNEHTAAPKPSGTER